jgi:hypothetical protein
MQVRSRSGLKSIGQYLCWGANWPESSARQPAALRQQGFSQIIALNQRVARVPALRQAPSALLIFRDTILFRFSVLRKGCFIGVECTVGSLLYAMMAA